MKELKRANEKYLNERLSTKSVKNEFENLENEIERLRRNNTRLEVAHSASKRSRDGGI